LEVKLIVLPLDVAETGCEPLALIAVPKADATAEAVLFDPCP